jgi:hypothetical protein
MITVNDGQKEIPGNATQNYLISTADIQIMEHEVSDFIAHSYINRA